MSKVVGRSQVNTGRPINRANAGWSYRTHNVSTGRPIEIRWFLKTLYLLSNAQRTSHRTSDRNKMISQTLCLLSDTSIDCIGCPILPTASWLFNYFLSIWSINEALFWSYINSAWLETSNNFYTLRIRKIKSSFSEKILQKEDLYS